MTDLIDSGGWVPLLDTTNEGPVTCDAATQTEGIFYPSSRTINKAMAATEAVIAWTNVKKPSGTYSPGRGNGLISGLCMIGAMEYFDPYFTVAFFRGIFVVIF